MKKENRENFLKALENYNYDRKVTDRLEDQTESRIRKSKR